MPSHKDWLHAVPRRVERRYNCGDMLRRLRDNVGQNRHSFVIDHGSGGESVQCGDSYWRTGTEYDRSAGSAMQAGHGEYLVPGGQYQSLQGDTRLCTAVREAVNEQGE
jgi:hypothetical protein